MLEAEEGEVCLPGVLEVIRCVLLCILEALEVVRCVLLSTMEVPEAIRCVLLYMRTPWRMGSVCWRCRT